MNTQSQTSVAPNNGTLINYSVQLRQHGNKEYRSQIIYFKEHDEESAWNKVREIYNTDNPTNKHLEITSCKQNLYPQYSFANTYSRDWYYVLHWWHRKEKQQASREERAYSQPLNNNTKQVGEVIDTYIAQNKPTEEEPF